MLEKGNRIHSYGWMSGFIPGESRGGLGWRRAQRGIQGEMAKIKGLLRDNMKI